MTTTLTSPSISNFILKIQRIKRRRGKGVRREGGGGEGRGREEGGGGREGREGGTRGRDEREGREGGGGRDEREGREGGTRGRGRDEREGREGGTRGRGREEGEQRILRLLVLPSAEDHNRRHYQATLQPFKLHAQIY